MELTVENNFESLDVTELENIDGGSFLVACAIITAGVGVFKLGVEVGKELKKTYNTVQ